MIDYRISIQVLEPPIGSRNIRWEIKDGIGMIRYGWTMAELIETLEAIDKSISQP
tara:strand:+ start:87 stop:251 length:165 start_codon:yes stop_codon:yes gene_type:complete